VLFTACSKEEKQLINRASDQAFPDRVGDHWVYKYDDLNSNDKQYILVDIVGATTLPDGRSVSIWTSTLQDKSNTKYLIDSSYVTIDDQKAVFYAPPCLTCTDHTAYEKRRYIFPLRVGNTWFTNEFFGDTTCVLSNESLTVPAGMFNNTFQLSKTVGYVTNSFTKDSIWLTLNIGMTKYYQDAYSLGPIPGNGIWELESYDLK
jgi:hypothetical protein